MDLFYYEVIIEHASLQLNQSFTYSWNQKIEPGVRVCVPFRGKNIIGLIVERHPARPEADFRILSILEVLDDEPLLCPQLMDLASYVADLTLSPLMSVVRTMLPSAYKPSSSAARLVYDDWIVPVPAGLPVRLSPKQQQALSALSQECLASEARKTWGYSVIRALLDKGVVKLEKRVRQMQLASSVSPSPWPILRPAQQQALQAIQQSDNPAVLLHGVTGSGKTEVFFALAREVLDQGKQVLLLVPEIGLTPMMIRRVQSRFQEPLVIYHSRLNAAEAADQYRQVRAMKAGIVIGTRSACFLPFDNLGLIIMDEEHDASYKQDSMPKYHARDVVLKRAQMAGCKVIMASATPCLESYSRAVKGVYQLVEMKERIADSMPSIHLVDMKLETSYGALSLPLIEKIKDRLAKKEQVILLLNRRGYIPIARCTKCQEPLLCEDCGIPLSFHKVEHALVCHICGRHYPVPERCPSCGNPEFSDLGTGTQRLEETLMELFPAAKVVRMDADSTRGKNAHATLLDRFEMEGDILLGTQMVAKGLDFERVTLTGIINADSALARADYRASEVCYQMLEQASGRAGRGQYPGEVLIQTYNPDHYVMQFILHHDYRGFFVREMKYRHLGMYPPYLFMATLVFHHADLNAALQAASRARGWLESQGAKVYGPIELTMRKKIFRVRLLIKEKDHQRLQDLLWRYTHWHKEQLKSLKYELNIDPVSLEE